MPDAATLQLCVEDHDVESVVIGLAIDRHIEDRRHDQGHLARRRGLQGVSTTGLL